MFATFSRHDRVLEISKITTRAILIGTTQLPAERAGFSLFPVGRRPWKTRSCEAPRPGEPETCFGVVVVCRGWEGPRHGCVQTGPANAERVLMELFSVSDVAVTGYRSM